MGSTAVEAKSLSSITALAFNPPPYPRNPTHVKHEPLVLYIARVPGSRDVFLTPMKPRDKVVTAEDVQSSLYYLHFDQPEDARLVEPTNYPKKETPNEPRQPIIPRKAVPGSRPPGDPNFPNRPLSGAPIGAPILSSTQSQEPPTSGLTSRAGIDNRHNIASGNYPHQPFRTPNQYDKQHQSIDSFPLQQNENPPLPPRPSRDNHPPPRRADISSTYAPNGNMGREQPPRRPTHLNPSAPYSGPSPNGSPINDQDPSGGCSITLIRRDPASGAQWNVARIDDPPVPEVSSSFVNDPKPTQKRKTGAPMYIEINNQGYNKFVGAPEQPTLISRNTGDLPGGPTRTEERVGVSDKVFRRRLWMEGAKFGDRSFGHRKTHSRDAPIGRDGLLDDSGTFVHEGQVPNRLSTDLRSMTRDNQLHSGVQTSNRASTFRGYVFLSPWNGRCEFSTGGSGGSLKCKHYLPGYQGDVAPPPATVSELRFNLPGSSAAPSTSQGDDSKRSSIFHRPRFHRKNSSLSDIRSGSMENLRNSMDRLDLSLGQEFAGGGFGGKQAKLGKLIIEDEGLKMVDMIVAANLALWWRVYDKVDARAQSRRASLNS